MRTAQRLPLGKFSVSKMACIVSIFCAATAIASPAQFTTLVNFNGANGAGPRTSLIQGSDGNFYGTTEFGGAGLGEVFKMTPSGTLTSPPFYTFCSDGCLDGAGPVGAILQATDGNFYGTTYWGGQSSCSLPGCGTVFKITPGGTLTTLYSFCPQNGCHDGANPYDGLVQATDGNFYGTTSAGGNSGNGTVFKITPSGNLTTLYSFCSQSNCADGSQPYAGLVQGTDGNFYGTTTAGGINSGGCANLNNAPGCGTLFKITPVGHLSTLYTFCSQPNCADGATPYGTLAQATDGNFYGTTIEGGANHGGTVFEITPSGALNTLYSFCSQPGCADGALPFATLVQATDGNFYGTAEVGGSQNGAGAVFEITPTGTLTILHSFGGADGSSPIGGLVQATNGTFYGTTESGGESGNGTVFSLSGPSPTAVQFVPVTPCRVVDTRQANGEFGGPAITGGTFRTFPIPQNPNCNIPASAAYSLNVTVAPHQPLGYLTIWPAGRSQPTVSTMNSPDGRVKANAAIVPQGASGAVSVYATNTTDVILDIDGYFTTPGSQTYQFYPLTPCRLVDTRGADGELGGPRLQAQTPRDFPLLSSTCIPSGLRPLAYSLNFTVVPNPGGQQLGYLTVWPAGDTQPVVSTLNNPTATVVANAAIVPAGTNGDIDVYAYNTTDLLIDINGYFAAPGTNGLSMYPTAPCRVLDTRQNNGQPFMGQKTVNVVGSACAPPSNAAAYIFNATVVPPGSMPFLTLWPDGETQPVVSTLNAYDGFITSNMAIVPTTNGSIDAYAQGLTQLILDISGYFAP